MARTFNRNPLQVNTPSSKDVKNYFFNHFNWKGLNTDKNFLAVDQETFADSKNVYQNAEGLLRSRPSVKIKQMFVESAIDFWNFDNVDVYLCEANDRYDLHFVIENEIYSKTISDKNVKLVRIQNKIYCFTDEDFFYFDIDKLIFDDGFSKIYIPNTEFDASGTKTKVESKNILTDKEKYTYLYNSELGVSTEAYGKELTVKINEQKYSFVLSNSSLELLTDVLFITPSDYDYVSVSNNDTYLFYSSEKRTVSYSSSGKILSKTFIIPEEYGDIVGYPKFSQDSSYIIIGTNKSLYIVSVVADQSNGELRFKDFTDVKSYLPRIEEMYDNANIINCDYDFVTYDEFVYFHNDRSIGSLACHVNDSSIKYLNLYFKNIEKIVFNKGYRLTDGTSTIVNGLIAVLGECYESGVSKSGVFIFNAGDESESHEKYYEATDGSFAVLHDLKVTNNSILAVVNDMSERILLKIIRNNEISDSGDAFKTNVIGYEPITGDYLKTSKHLISDDGLKIFTGRGIYNLVDNEYHQLISKHTFYNHIGYGKYLYYLGYNNKVFSNLIKNNLAFEYLKDGNDLLVNPHLISRLNNFYFTLDNTLYISDYREEDGEFKWYFPEVNKQIFDSVITGLHPISSTEMGVFFDNAIWYVNLSEQGYRYTKSKLELGVKSGSDIIASYDGSRLIFPTERGIVALSYQDFVASTDQVITFLSDAIHLQMEEFCKQPVHSLKIDYWIIFYNSNKKDLYVLDSRNNSWWPWSLPMEINKFVKYDEDLLLCSNNGRFYQFDKSNDDYFDYDEIKYPIDWYVESQKLHLSSLNNYKHLINITFNSVIDTEDYLSFFLDVKNYRENVDSGKIENPHYSVDVLRTFVQRLNYFKVNEFQYILRSDNDNKFPLPLSLSSISIKYKIQGQVR